MDLLKIIRELRDERDRLERAILSLEALTANGEVIAYAPPVKRRGRKSMSEEERKIVAKRMKEYWRKKRAQ